MISKIATILIDFLQISDLINLSSINKDARCLFEYVCKTHIIDYKKIDYDWHLISKIEHLKNVNKIKKIINFDNLKSITFDANFNKKLTLFTFPPKIAKNIIHIEFARNYTQNISYLEKFNNLTTLIFGDNFNKNVDNLPQNLQYLKFGKKFNQKIDNLPKNLQYLIFTKNSMFNQFIDKLPNNIITIIMGWYFNRNINKLPQKLKYFEISQNYKSKMNALENCQNLQILCVGDYKQICLVKIPKNTHVIFNKNKKYERIMCAKE